jgi:hypothetical protein
MPRLRIEVGADLHLKTQAALEALVAANDEREPAVMVRGSSLVRMTERGELEAFGIDSLCERLSEAASFGKEKDGGWVGQDPPRNVANALLARDSGQYEGLPKVDGVVDVPVLAPDGALITEPGHHTSGLYYRPAQGMGDVRPGNVELVSTVEGALAALVGRDGLLGAFDFADRASLANALALTVLPFVRPYIGDAPTPLHLVVAPQPDCGKTYLAQACLIPGCGLVEVTPGSRDPEEWRKQITSTLRSGAGGIVFDNLHGQLDSGPLAAALTTGRWRSRILGESRDEVLDVRNAWVATGNNVGLSRELARRSVALALDPGDGPPAGERDGFPHEDLHAWAQAHRAELAGACLTLVRHWLDGAAPSEVWSDEAGEGVYYGRECEPHEGRTTRGSYRRWASIVGGVVAAAGVPDFDANRAWLSAQADEETREAAEFLAAWRALGLGPVPKTEVARLCGMGGPLADHLPGKIADAGAQQRDAVLRAWLRDHRGTRFGGYQLRAEDGRTLAWWVQDRRADPEERAVRGDSAGAPAQP